MKLKALSICISFFFMKSITIQAQQGSLDNTFGNEGIVLTNGSTGSNKIAIQNDGKIISITSVTINTLDLAISRFNEDGTIDPSFGNNGVKMIDISGAQDYCTSLAIQPDGKILISSISSETDNFIYVIIRLNSDGLIDSSFGNQGFLTLSNEIADYFYLNYAKVSIQIDGKILFNIKAGDFASPHYSIYRFNSDGSTDGFFADNGVYTFEVGNASAISSFFVQSDKIFIIGSVNDITSAYRNLVFQRLNLDGSFDGTYGINGTIVSDLGYSIDAFSCSIQNDDKILIAGVTNQAGVPDINVSTIWRFNIDGTLDNSFGTNGKVFTEMGIDAEEYWTNIIIQTNNKIVVNGILRHDNDNDQNDITLARFESNGILDESFGIFGKTFLNLDSMDVATDLKLQSDGKIMICGYSFDLTNPPKMLIARYLSDESTNVIDNKNNKLYSISPNPFSEIITIFFAEIQENSLIKLIDNLGQEINHFQFSGKDFVLSRGTLQSGVYFIEITDKNKNISIEKIVVN